ncbi:hypothetical protein GLOIN_2v1478983 [Rhizophagus irregularis DAOM 181602=DAOM 197198]|nr:hypothetical protein GLOIN_2v1478983 [Rhizophagus irregularis DAOM 181602=DAOM 197198]
MSSRNSRWEHERHDWFNCHIWSVIFDQAFGDINVISDRQGREYKFGSVTNGDKHELGAGEAGSVWTDDHGTNICSELKARRRKRPRDISQRHLSGCMSTLKKAKKAKNENACAEVNDERPYPESPCPGSPSSEPLI